ncbi:MAG: hypothetical protein ACKVU1_06700 [bacterium]
MNLVAALAVCFAFLAAGVATAAPKTSSSSKTTKAPAEEKPQAPPVIPKDAATRDALFRKQWLEAHLALAKAEKPYLLLDPNTGELRLLIRGVPLAAFPAEGVLAGMNLEKLAREREPYSPLVKPFVWSGFEKSATADAIGTLTVMFEPPLRIDFQTSPSDFYWMRIRRKITERLPWAKKESGLSLTLFQSAESLVSVAPVLADSFPLLFAPGELPSATDAVSEK